MFQHRIILSIKQDISGGATNPATESTNVQTILDFNNGRGFYCSNSLFSINGIFSGNLGIGTANALGSNSIVLGDNDTGFKQNGDGLLDAYANGVHVFRFQNGTLQSKKEISITGRILPSDFSNLDSRYVKDVRLGSQQYYGVNNWQTWNFQCPSGHVLSGINVQDTGSNSADNIAGVYYRPVQKYINGTWYNVASV